LCADGSDAVGRFDGTFAPDLVLMDVQLPGMDGIEAMSRIRARGYRGRIAALTAAALGAEHERAAAAGCERIALKPISRSDLVALCVGGAAAYA
jgi:two-component system NarL family response regulator